MAEPNSSTVFDDLLKAAPQAESQPATDPFDDLLKAAPQALNERIESQQSSGTEDYGKQYLAQFGGTPPTAGRAPRVNVEPQPEPEPRVSPISRAIMAKSGAAEKFGQTEPEPPVIPASTAWKVAPLPKPV
ncbi:MAG: hypothetical protein M1541_05235, partial [Acidobacteria bacterium]|nr:hypothetical protein [Acidobacteriota bacterium]